MFKQYLLSAGVVLCAMSVSHADITLNLTTAGATETNQGVTYTQFDPQSTGTGVIDSFLRIQKNNTEKGYNTDGALQFDTKAGAFTHSIQVGDLAVKTVGGQDFYTFVLDINENKGGNNEFLSLNQIQIYIADSTTLTGYTTVADGTPAPATNLGGSATLVFDLDAVENVTIELNFLLNAGSGSGDIFIDIPAALFGSDLTKSIYFFNRFGSPNNSDDGFEEWAGVTKEPGVPFGVPEPSSIILMGFGAVGLAGFMRRKRIAA